MSRHIPRHILIYGTIIVLLLLVGTGAYLAVQADRNETQSANAAPIVAVSAVPASTDGLNYGSWPDLAKQSFFAQAQATLISQNKRFIEADLSALKLRVYDGANVILEVPIKTIGREGSWWQTPVGLYTVQSKEQNHFSSFGHVYMPWSMEFQGNFFIHGWPYEPDGTPVSTQYSGGCIRMETSDAEKVYNLMHAGDPILIFQSKDMHDGFAYTTAASSFNADDYLVADVNNDAVLAAKSSNASTTMGSATHLLAALVAVEYINIESKTTVPSDVTPSARLSPGDRVSVYDLLHLVLAEHNEDALYTIENFIGQKRFINLMNSKAQSIGMPSTHITSIKAADTGNTTTDEDLFALGSYLMHNRSFILNLTYSIGNNAAYGAPVFSNLSYDQSLTSLAGFKGGVRDTTSPGMAFAIFNIQVGSTTRPIFIAASNAKDPGAILSDMRTWLQSTYERSL